MKVSSQDYGDESVKLSLADIRVDQEIRIVDIHDLNENVKKHLYAYGLTSGRAIKVISTHPELIIQIEETELALENSIARSIHVDLI